MTVTYLALDRENTAILPELLAATERVARSGHVLYGPELEAFEHELSEYMGVKYAVGLASGTDSVEVALRAVGWGASPVRVTAMTAPATMNAIDAAHIRSTGRGWNEKAYTAKLLDIDPRTYNATGADVHVHLYGLATDATGATVEDCAHSFGAKVNGKMAGTMGKVGACSAYPTKILGALGDGGFLITNDERTAKRARKIRHYGMTETKEVVARGQNSRLCELQAAFLRVKLKYVDGWIARRMEIANRYNVELAGKVQTQANPVAGSNVYHCFVATHPERDRIREALRNRGIDTMIHYDRAIHQHAMWSHLGSPGQFPHAERLAREVFSLPIGPYMRDDEVDEVIKAVREVT